jgi:hypothetical protein
LFWQYGEPIEFERRFREHLTHQILQLKKGVAAFDAAPKLFFSYKREDIEGAADLFSGTSRTGVE